MVFLIVLNCPVFSSAQADSEPLGAARQLPVPYSHLRMPRLVIKLVSLYLLIQKYWISILKLFILQILSFIKSKRELGQMEAILGNDNTINSLGITSFMTNAPRSKERGAGMSNSSEKKKRYNIPLWCKPNLSIEEAAAYSGIGMGKLYEMTESQDCPFVLWIGSRRMIKRKVFDEFIERQYSI